MGAPASRMVTLEIAIPSIPAPSTDSMAIPLSGARPVSRLSMVQLLMRCS